jgi:hypothetical protein
MSISKNATYCVRTSAVVSENIDGEVIAIHLKRGHYYSMRGTAALIWGWLDAAGSRQTIETRLTDLFGWLEEPMWKTVDEFLGQLVEEGLAEETPEVPSLTEAGAPASNGASRGVFEPPILERHTDMQDLLVLDPIHDVGERGWPNPKDG